MQQKNGRPGKKARPAWPDQPATGRTDPHGKTTRTGTPARRHNRTEAADPGESTDDKRTPGAGRGQDAKQTANDPGGSDPTSAADRRTPAERPERQAAGQTSTGKPSDRAAATARRSAPGEPPDQTPTAPAASEASGQGRDLTDREPKAKRTGPMT